MTNEEYHADTTRISKSGLDLIDRSPLHYWERYLNPEREPSEPTPALVQGSIFHTATLEPHLLSQEYIVAPKVDRRTKAGKEAYEEFLTLAGGKTVVTQEQYDVARRMADACRKHPLLAEILADGAAEQTVFWDDKETGAPCKCRPDWLSTIGIVLDLKSTQDASKDSFGRSAFNYRYHVQSPYYLDGLAASGHVFNGFVFAAVESTAPYAVALYYVDDHVNDLGRYRYRKNLETYMQCKTTGEWPGLPDEITPLELPAYAFKTI